MSNPIPIPTGSSGLSTRTQHGNSTNQQTALGGVFKQVKLDHFSNWGLWLGTKKEHIWNHHPVLTNHNRHNRRNTKVPGRPLRANARNTSCLDPFRSEMSAMKRSIMRSPFHLLSLLHSQQVSLPVPPEAVEILRTDRGARPPQQRIPPSWGGRAGFGARNRVAAAPHGFGHAAGTLCLADLPQLTSFPH